MTLRIHPNWFFAAWGTESITTEMMRAWAIDLLALGPHAEWIEPETLSLALSGEYEGKDPIAFAAQEIAFSNFPRTIFPSAMFLRGLVDTPDDKDVVPTADQRNTVLEPLWARSLDKIRTRMLAMTLARLRESLLFDVNMLPVFQDLLLEQEWTWDEEEIDPADQARAWNEAMRLSPRRFELSLRNWIRLQLGG